MEIRQLKTLVCILDFGGFASAGEALGLTQSAISLQIKALEQEFGENLFDRSKRPPVPTLKAIDLARKSREILRLCNDLNSTSANQYSGSIQLGTVQSIQRIILPKALKALTKKHPELFIKLHTGLSSELLNNVHRGILDAAIISEPQQLPMGLNWNPLVSKSLMVISNRKAKGTTAKEILEKNPYIQFKRSTSSGGLIESEFKRLGIKVHPVIETDNLASIWQIVSSGVGVSIMPQYFYDLDMVNETNHTDANLETNTNGKNLRDKLIPSNINVTPISESSLKLVTGLVSRSNDSKEHLIDILLSSFKG